MNKRVCENCRWWENDQHAIGACMRYPPGVSELVPKTHATDWCGEWSDASITPEQEDRQKFVRQIVLAMISSDLISTCSDDLLWENAKNLAAAEPQIQREVGQ